MRKIAASSVLLLIVLMIPLVAGATEQTCKDVDGFGTNQEASTSGTWGSITFSNTESTLTLVVAEGWEVKLCVKAGSAKHGNGPEVTGWIGEGEHLVGHSSGKDLSHFDFIVREVPDDDDDSTTTTTSTTIQDTTTTTVADTTTTTIDDSTTTTAGDTTTTIGQLVEWSGSTTCESVTATWGAGIISVEVFAGGDELAALAAVPPGPRVAVISAPGERVPIGVATPVRFTLIPVTEEGVTVSPEQVTLTVQPCPEEVTTTTGPTGSTLPFTGVDSGVLVGLGASLMATGALALFGVRRKEVPVSIDGE